MGPWSMADRWRRRTRVSRARGVGFGLTLWAIAAAANAPLAVAAPLLGAEPDLPRFESVYYSMQSVLVRMAVGGNSFTDPLVIGARRRIEIHPVQPK
jgi:hypothetical protein